MFLRRGRLASAFFLTATLLSACAQTYASCQLQPQPTAIPLPEGCRVQWEGQQGGAFFICDDGREGFAG